jgi:sarcosine oxidase subunit gamma
MALNEQRDRPSASTSATTRRLAATVAFKPIDLGATLRISPLPPQVRYSIQGGQSVIAAVASALGLEPPTKICASSSAENVQVLRLGPSEWQVIAPAAQGEATRATLARTLTGNSYSFVDISHRNAGFQAEGAQAATVLNTGCPLDLRDSAFPVGACSRTVFHKAEVMIWRVGSASYSIEAARSFCAYIGACLAEASREYHTQ